MVVLVEREIVEVELFDHGNWVEAIVLVVQVPEDVVGSGSTIDIRVLSQGRSPFVNVLSVI